MPTIEETIIEVAQLKSRVTEIEKLIEKMSKEVHSIVDTFKEASKQSEKNKGIGLV